MSGHSEAYFHSFRNFWWNTDYIELLVKRWGLADHSQMLDVGCGCFHWSKTLAPYLKKPATVTGLDRDEKWAAGSEAARAWFSEQNIELDVVQGDAMQLPFADNSFDLATCQTVLIHLSDPLAAVNEMKRVVKPGGLVICAEPNNLAGTLMRDSLNANEPFADTLDRVAFNLLYERGKKKLGEGDQSFGDRLRETLMKAGLLNVQAYLSDKCCFAMHPPYAEAGMKELAEMLNDWLVQEVGPFDLAEALRYFEALDEQERDMELFYRQWEKQKQQVQEILTASQQQTYHAAGACVMYVAAGIKE